MIEIMMMLEMKLLWDRGKKKTKKKTTLAKQKGDITANQQVRAVCDWLGYFNTEGDWFKGQSGG